MDIFKEETETKRVIFNVRMDLAVRLEKAKKEARSIGKKLDVDSIIDKELEKFLKKAEKKLSEIKRKKGLCQTDDTDCEENCDPDDETENDPEE